MRRIFGLFFIFIFVLGPVLNAEPYIDKMGEVIEDVSLVNLLRGMYLTKEQVAKITEMALSAEEIRANSLDKIKSFDPITQYAKLRDALYTSLPEAPPAFRSEVVEIDNKLHDTTGEALDKIAGMEEKIRALLSPGQLQIFDEFVPCIVPELDFENPVRTGQAAASSRLMPVVELIRNTPEDMWKKHGQAYLDHMLKILEQEVGKMTNEVREDLRRRFVKQAWKIRKMKEADFLIKRSDLAEELMLVNREHTMRSGFRITGKIARFFLSPSAARVFPKWQKIHFGNGAPAENNTEKIKKLDKSAEDCKQKSSNIKPVVDPVKKSHKSDSNSDKDKEFWEVKVPNSLTKFAEMPFYDHVLTAYRPAYSASIFLEQEKDVDVYRLLKEAEVILTKKGDLTFYKKVQGEP